MEQTAKQATTANSDVYSGGEASLSGGICPSVESGKTPGGRDISVESGGMNTLRGGQKLKSVGEGREGEGRGVEWWESPRQGTACAKTQSKGTHSMDREPRGELGEKGLAGGGERQWPHHAGLSNPL